MGINWTAVELGSEEDDRRRRRHEAQVQQELAWFNALPDAAKQAYVSPYPIWDGETAESIAHRTTWAREKIRQLSAIPAEPMIEDGTRVVVDGDQVTVTPTRRLFTEDELR